MTVTRNIALLIFLLVCTQAQVAKAQPAESSTLERIPLEIRGQAEIDAVKILFPNLRFSRDEKGSWFCEGTAQEIDQLFELGVGQGSSITRNRTSAFQSAFNHAKDVELLQLNPARIHPRDRAWFKSYWNGYEVVHSVVLSGESKNRVLDAMWRGVSEGEGHMLCFEPRHGLAARHQGKTFEMVICFECRLIKALIDSNRILFPSTSTSPRSVMDAVLNEHR